MLEKVISLVVNKALGDYVEGFDSSNIDLSLFSTTTGIGMFFHCSVFLKEKKKWKIILLFS